MPTIEKTVGSIAELRASSESANVDDFDVFTRLTGQVQQRLLALSSPQALGLCRSLLQIESDYLTKSEAAVTAAQATIRDADRKSPLGARNTRTLDKSALAGFLRENFPQEKDLSIAKVEFISGGYSKFTASITLENAESLSTPLILRGDASATYRGASVVDEFRLIKALYENGVCVAKPVAMEKTGNIFGSPFLLPEKIRCHHRTHVQFAAGKQICSNGYRQEAGCNPSGSIGRN